MSCLFTEKISSLIDGELGPAEAREVERHVVTCVECEQLKADFLKLRSQIAGFETSLQPAVSNRALRKILSREDRVGVRGLRWAWSMPAIAFASLLIIGAIIALIVYQSSPNKDSGNLVVHAPSPVPSPTIEKNNEPVPDASPKEETPKETKNPERAPST
ncbi:MAG TPA: zf-HC2 domain-containing protein, partial [Pyrinomonadaceae bacterium]|nr:zf-HC2 domain-containing protein [Pyrinomonadaceae bacterium]